MKLVNLLRLVLACLIYLSASSVFAAHKIKVTFVSPNPPGTGYWQHYDKAMHSAANALNIDLTIIHSQDLDRFAYLDAIEKVDINNTEYVIALLKTNVADILLNKFESTSVKVFTSNLEVPEKHKSQVGKPRDKYKNWIGHVIPDDYHAGQLLAETLLHEYSAKKDAESGVLAITGARDASVSFLRTQGLQDVIKGNSLFRLEQIFYTDWKYETAREKFELALKRYPQTKIIWCASDEIATAVLDVLKDSHAQGTYRVGSIDWSQRGIDAFSNDDYLTSIGGHFLEGGMILALIRDYHEGNDFAASLGTQIKMKMGALTHQNLVQVSDLIQNDNWYKLKFNLLSHSMGGSSASLHSDYQSVLNQIYP